MIKTTSLYHTLDLTNGCSGRLTALSACFRKAPVHSNAAEPRCQASEP